MKLNHNAIPQDCHCHWTTVCCWIIQSRPASAPVSTELWKLHPFTHSRFHLQPGKSLSLPSLGTKRMKTNLLHQGKCHPHFSCGCCPSTTSQGQQDGQDTQDGVTSTPECLSQPGSDAILSLGSAPTALSHQIKDQRPNSFPSTQDYRLEHYLPHRISLEKSSGSSHISTWDHHTSPQFLWLFMNFMLSWFLSGEVEEWERVRQQTPRM